MALTLTRDIGQKLIINGNIIIEIKAADRGQAKLSITAPREITIDREEIHEKKKKEFDPAYPLRSSW